jgi:c(7)-type cytochrome triheme protein
VPSHRSWTVAVTMIVVILALASSGSAQVKPPADFTFEKGKDSPGAVTFSHEKHKERGVAACSTCHVKVFKMKKGTTGPLTMAKMKTGEQCGACHNGKTQVAGKVPFSVDEQAAACDKCHKN